MSKADWLLLNNLTFIIPAVYTSKRKWVNHSKFSWRTLKRPALISGIPVVYIVAKNQMLINIYFAEILVSEFDI